MNKQFILEKPVETKHDFNEIMSRYEFMIIASSPCKEKIFYHDLVKHYREKSYNTPVMSYISEKMFPSGEFQVPSVSAAKVPQCLIVNLAEVDHVQIQEAINTENYFIYPHLTFSYHEGLKFLLRHSDMYTQAGILTTDFCNLNCRMCMFHSNDADAYSFSSHRIAGRKRQSVNPSHVYNYIDKLPDGTVILFSASGELLVLKDNLKYIDYAIRHDKKAALITNGVLMNPDIMEILIEKGVQQFTFSVDGYTREIYESFRVGSDFDTVLNNIRCLKEYRDKNNLNILININSILFKETAGREDEIISFWEGKADQLSLMAERINYLGQSRELFFEPPSEHNCFALFDGPLMLSNGKISPCCNIAIAEWFEPFLWLHNIDDMPLNDIVHSYRQMMLDNDSPLQQFCSRCGYWANSYWKGNTSPFAKSITLK